MNEIKLIEKRIAREVVLKGYKGQDRVIYAEDKRNEIEEDRAFKPKFAAMTGLLKFDSFTEGFRKGQLVVVSGPPKHGKTALCQTFTKRFVEQGMRCLWFSYELRYEELFDKFPMEKLDFYMPNYMESGNLSWIEDRIIEAKQKHNVDAVFIDHLDFLRDPEVLRDFRGNSNTSVYIGSIIQKVKCMAMENDVVIFLLAHIRKNRWLSQELPASEELSDSRKIPQLADLVVMIIRLRKEGMYDGNRALFGIIENRHNGRTGKIKVEFRDKEFFEEETLDDKIKEYVDENTTGNFQGTQPDWMDGAN